MGSRHGIAKRLNGAAPGGGRMRAVPLGFLRLPRPVGTDGRRVYAMPPFLRALPPWVRTGGVCPLSGEDREGLAAIAEVHHAAHVSRRRPLFP